MTKSICSDETRSGSASTSSMMRALAALVVAFLVVALAAPAHAQPRQITVQVGELSDAGSEGLIVSPREITEHVTAATAADGRFDVSILTSDKLAGLRPSRRADLQITGTYLLEEDRISVRLTILSPGDGTVKEEHIGRTTVVEVSEVLRDTLVSLLTRLPASAGAEPLLGVGPIESADTEYVHVPFELGECSLCHEGDDPEAPGPVSGPITELCFNCHDQLSSMLAGMPSSHEAATDSCTNCHNPHNSPVARLLLASPPTLCFGCHAEIESVATGAPVSHLAVTTGKSCLNCHNPHAANVESLLVQLPYDLCVSCHSEDGVTDDAGKELTNIGALLAQNPEQHGPVAAKDCAACHETHGGEQFRLLVDAYPPKFYAPYEPSNYGLCFQCHNDQMVADETTTTLTNFRDGDRNLHYLHVNRPDMGRTCRACHEVHAAENAHIIRNEVPYGKGGWMLPVNFEVTPGGGQCNKTCHKVGVYERTEPGQ